MTTLHPKLISKKHIDGKVELTLHIPSDLMYLEGHFPGLPIVPGVTQLHWAIEFASKTFEIHMDIEEVRQLKFSNIIAPESKVSLVLELDPIKKICIYSYKVEEKTYSSGSFVYKELT